MFKIFGAILEFKGFKIVFLNSEITSNKKII